MAAQSNLSGVPRFGYTVAGLIMIGLGFFYVDPGFWRYFLPIAGGGVFVAGLIGFCPIRAMMGIGAKKT